MKKSRKTIGTNVVVTLPNDIQAPAKIDTGADGTAIWASKIKEKNGELSFVLFDKKSPYYTGEVIKTNEFSEKKIRSSHGDIQVRYATKFWIKFCGKKINANVTLADRSENTFPILIGRRTLKGKFDVDLSKRELNMNDNGTFSLISTDDEFDGPNGKTEINTNNIKKLKIAILSNGTGNYSTKRLKRAAENRGHKIDVIKYKDCFVSVDLKDPKVVYKGTEIDIKQYDAIIPRIALSLIHI